MADRIRKVSPLPEGACNAENLYRIQKELNGQGGGIIMLIEGIFNVTERIPFDSNVHWVGSENKKSLIKINSQADFNIFEAGVDCTNVIFSGISFDGSLNYPADSKQAKADLSNNTAIAVSGRKLFDFTVVNCDFQQMSGASIYLRLEVESDGIKILNNTGSKCSYAMTAIAIGTVDPDEPDEAHLPRNIEIINNTMDLCGPQFHWDPSDEQWIASSDGIQLNRCQNATIVSNKISRTGGVGIRIEKSLRVTVANNLIEDAGQDCITFYRETRDCVCIGNRGSGWGRIPAAYGIRKFKDDLIVARESPNEGKAELVDDPLTLTWFESWPYSINEKTMDMGRIIRYDKKDYYKGINIGILPFRGYAFISYTHGSRNILIISNTGEANLAKDGYGKNLYAADYGLTPVHSVNHSIDEDHTGENCRAILNRIDSARIAPFYHPEYHDEKTKQGMLGNATYVDNWSD